MRSLLFVLVGGFLVGVLIRSLVPLQSASVLFCLLLACGACLFAYITRMRTGLLVGLLLFAVACGIVRTERAYVSYESARTYVDGATVCVEAVVDTEPDVREDATVLSLAVLAADTRGRTETGTRLRTKVPRYPALSYGDTVSACGTLSVPRAFLTETGRVFAYDGYLMKEGIHYELRESDVTRRGTGGGSTLLRILLAFKNAWLSSVSQLLPEPMASLAGGLIVGAKHSLGEEWLALFRTTGIIHIVVLSGYNLTLIVQGMLFFTQRLPRHARYLLGVCGVVCFALMTGASATVLRASVMALLAMLAEYIGRPYAVLRALAVAAGGMVLVNPFILVFDPGFQLSFMATLGLLLGAPILDKPFSFVTERLGLRAIVSATFATQLAVLPLLLFQLGSVSLVAPFVNLLVLPLVSLVMAVGFAAGMIGMASTLLAVPFSWIAHAILFYMFQVVWYFGTLPFASIALPPVSFLLVVAYYGLCIAVLFYVRTRPAAAGRV